MQYTSHYSPKTSMQSGVAPRTQDILARSQLMRDMGMTIVGETWMSAYGLVPIWNSPRELTQDEQDVLCLKAWDGPKV